MAGTLQSARYRRLVKLLIQARKEAGLTQRSLAYLLGKPSSFVAKYELRERRLDVIEFLNIAEALSVDPCLLIREVA